MKRFLFLILITPGILSAQKNWTFPKRLTIGGLEASIPNQERNMELDPAGYFSAYVENFHPIGWSLDGKAAYLTWDEGEFYCHMGLVIYDAVHDSIAAIWFDNFGETNAITSEQIFALWKRDKDSLQPLLKHYKIVADTNALYSDFPFSYEEGKIKKDFNLEYSLHTSTIDNRYYDSISLICEISQATKTDSVQLYFGNFYDVDLHPSGIWMSPERKYALLVLVIETGGQHGTEAPHNIEYVFKTMRLPE